MMHAVVVGSPALGPALLEAGFSIDVVATAQALSTASQRAGGLDLFLHDQRSVELDEIDALLAMLLCTRDAVRAMAGPGRIVHLVGSDRPILLAGARALGRALREELQHRAIAITTLSVSASASLTDISRLVLLAGLEEALLSFSSSVNG